MTLFYHEAALDDLAEHWTYYAANHSELSAQRVVDEIQRVCGLFVANPYIGRSRPELTSGVRSFPCGKHVIYYRVDEERSEVAIVRILHGSRDTVGMDFA